MRAIGRWEDLLMTIKARDFLVVRSYRAIVALLAACSRRRGESPLGYFLLVFAFSLPFWLAGALTELRLLPGLPVSALMFVCPAAAAALLLYAANGTVGVRALLERSFDHGRMGTKIWYAPALLLMPAAMVLMYGLMRSTGLSLPSPEFPVMAAPALFVAFFFSALGEELGWSGYATDPLQDRRGALRAAVILGSVSAAWHVVPLAQVGRSPGWIAWWCLFTVAGRVLIVWVYNNAGKSVFAATLFHASSNVSWQLFPNQGSHWDPRIGATTVLVAAAAVTYLWGPKTLSRFRYGTRAA